MIPAIVMYTYYGKVVGDVAALAAGVAPPRGPEYYVLLAVGLVATRRDDADHAGGAPRRSSGSGVDEAIPRGRPPRAAAAPASASRRPVRSSAARTAAAFVAPDDQSPAIARASSRPAASA